MRRPGAGSVGRLLLPPLTAALPAGAALQPPRELWGYVQVRSKAHIFWWLYYADSRTAGFAELPLILWLQVSTARCCAAGRPVPALQRTVGLVGRNAGG